MDNQRRDDWLRAVYEAQDTAGHSVAANVAPLLGMDPDNNQDDRNLWRRIGRYWHDQGFIRNVGSKTGLAFEIVQITAPGIRYVEEGEPTGPQGPSITIAGNVYGSAIGTSGGSVEISNVFTFNDLEGLIEERGGEDREALHEMAREIRQGLEGQDIISREWLGEWMLRYSELLNRHGWITGPIATLLLAWSTGQAF